MLNMIKNPKEIIFTSWLYWKYNNKTLLTNKIQRLKNLIYNLYNYV